jgi:prepilin-type N-terminal cleavage/methylation domain-containing protein
MHMTRRLREADGFTLVELLVTIVILGVIALPLANIVISYFLNSSTTSARLNESHDEQIAAAYWQQDVSSLGVHGAFDVMSGTFAVQRAVNTTLGCALPPGTVLLTLAWNDYDQSGAATLAGAAYLQQGTSLIRAHCTGSSLDSTATLAHNLADVPTCDFGSGAAACASGTGTPATIAMTLSIADPSGEGQPYTVTLSGQRRQT